MRLCLAGRLLVALIVGASMVAIGGRALATGTRCPTSEAHPGDTAAPEEIAAWMGRSVQQHGLPPELPVMAALVESGLRHDASGHRHADSLGYFQMRVGVWNGGRYLGYPERPELQVAWFVDQASNVRQGSKAGPAGFRGDPNSYGKWIADIERPSEGPQYGASTYQAALPEARQLLLAACERDRPPDLVR